MRFELLAEGKTEKVAVRGFLHRAVNKQLSGRVGISLTRFEGNGDYLRKAVGKTLTFLSASDASEIVAVIGLLDLYGLPRDWQLGKTPSERHDKVKARIEAEVGDVRFRQFFAVHETEAWLLSDLSILPRGVGDRLASLTRTPETVNFNHPPAKRLGDAYVSELNKGYKKTVDGKALFDKLDPAVVLDKCPYFKAMIDEMVGLAKSAGA